MRFPGTTPQPAGRLVAVFRGAALPLFWPVTLLAVGFIASAGSALAGPPTDPAPAASAPTEPEPAAASAPTEPEPEPLVTAIDVGGTLGFGVRLDEPAALAGESRVGLRLGLGADVFFSRVVSVGLRVEHLDLGREASGLTSSGSVRVERDLNSLWLGLRAYPFESEPIGAFVHLGAAAVWQSLDAVGIGWLPNRPSTARAFRCEGSDSISMALRAGLGVDFEVTDGLRLVSAASFDTYRLTDEVLDGCAPGAGNASVLTAELSLAYRFAPNW